MSESTEAWFDRLYQENVPDMTRLARAALGSPETAEDVVQDVFVILLAKEQRVRTYKNPKGWLYLALKNQIGNYLQSMRYRKALSLEENRDTASTDNYHFSLADSLPKGLKPQERELLIQFFDEGRSYEEIAASLGCSVLTCRTKLCRAKAHYKDLYLKENKF